MTELWGMGMGGLGGEDLSKRSVDPRLARVAASDPHDDVHVLGHGAEESAERVATLPGFQGLGFRVWGGRGGGGAPALMRGEGTLGHVCDLIAVRHACTTGLLAGLRERGDQPARRLSLPRFSGLPWIARRPSRPRRGTWQGWSRGPASCKGPSTRSGTEGFRQRPMWRRCLAGVARSWSTLGDVQSWLMLGGF